MSTMHHENIKQGLFDSILSSSYEWYDSEEQTEEELVFYGEDTDLPLFDETDKTIVMQRDAHFSGSFSAMVEYYQQEYARGIHQEIILDRITFLQKVEQGLKKNLASVLVTGRDAEKVAYARKIYKQLAQVSQVDSPEGAIATAILSEESIEKSVDTLVSLCAQDPKVLVSIASSDLFADPLFPGYGVAAQLAVTALGKLRYEPAIQPLFSLIGRCDFSIESAVLRALREIGEPVRKIILQKLVSRPYTTDNERAALILLEFLPDEEISRQFSLLLSQERTLPDLFREYLTMGLVS